MPLILSLLKFAFPNLTYLCYLNLPIFLNCWIADVVLQDMLHDIYRISSVKYDVLSREILALFSTVFCLIFSGACGMEMLQRGGTKLDLFTCFYFVFVTFSTVGFGDVSPNTNLSRLYVILLIIAGICVLPKKVILYDFALYYFIYF